MNSPVISFHRWIGTTVSRRPLHYCGRAFAGIWLSYDLIDMTYRGTKSLLFLGGGADRVGQLNATQIALIVIQALWVFGIYPRAMALLAAAVRGFETSFYSLNDFRYYCIICLILAASDSLERGDDPALAWPRDLLVAQTAWIYFASAFLKLNPPFLSGGELYVRQMYLLEALNWPYPVFYQKAISSLPVNSGLSWLGVAGELTVAFLLATWLFCPKQRRGLRIAILVLLVGIHGFAAVALNVFFFGISLITQVALMTWQPSAKSPLSSQLP